MSDPMTSLFALQKQMLDAQRTSLSAMQKGVGLGDSLVAMQQAGHKAVEANLAAWSAWGKVWGLK